MRRIHVVAACTLALLFPALSEAAPGEAAAASHGVQPRVIGGYANGCLAGAYALPAEGPGFQVIRLSRKRFYGHPDLIGFLQEFGRAVAEARLGVALVGDMAQARGGPMPSGHASHQTGLDVDIWFRLDLPPLPRERREDLEEISMVDADARTVVPSRWTDRQERMVRLAAGHPSVDRIFVSPPIKHALCRSAGTERAWLRKVRPWFGHTGHMHVRLRCPSDSPECVPQDPPPPGDGCGDELASWFAPPPATPAAPAEPRPPRILPAACAAVLDGGS